MFSISASIVQQSSCPIGLGLCLYSSRSSPSFPSLPLFSSTTQIFLDSSSHNKSPVAQTPTPPILQLFMTSLLPKPPCSTFLGSEGTFNSTTTDLHEVMGQLLTTKQQIQQIEQDLHAIRLQTNLQHQLQALAKSQIESTQTCQKLNEDLFELLSTPPALDYEEYEEPPPFTPKFKGLEGTMSFEVFASKLITQRARYPVALGKDVDLIHYAFSSMEGPPSRFLATYINKERIDPEGILTDFNVFLEEFGLWLGNQLH
ncbi:hypothetical protein EMPS_03873 [Entomortierella parvispora]|uniref:Uncharacterized protein n=1 Tax=Entomortierella parvispora TaxID=205924 RepID=A0A9P3H7L6_9FUNG|nr:hypothetical protein EMPS_03873 [Entomortierella parvispora]